MLYRFRTKNDKPYMIENADNSHFFLLHPHTGNVSLKHPGKESCTYITMLNIINSLSSAEKPYYNVVLSASRNLYILLLYILGYHTVIITATSTTTTIIYCNIIHNTSIVGPFFLFASFLSR